MHPHPVTVCTGLLLESNGPQCLVSNNPDCFIITLRNYFIRKRVTPQNAHLSVVVVAGP